MLQSNSEVDLRIENSLEIANESEVSTSPNDMDLIEAGEEHKMEEIEHSWFEQNQNPASHNPESTNECSNQPRNWDNSYLGCENNFCDDNKNLPGDGESKGNIFMQEKDTFNEQESQDEDAQCQMDESLAIQKEDNFENDKNIPEDSFLSIEHSQFFDGFKGQGRIESTLEYEAATKMSRNSSFDENSLVPDLAEKLSRHGDSRPSSKLDEINKSESSQSENQSFSIKSPTCNFENEEAEWIVEDENSTSVLNESEIIPDSTGIETDGPHNLENQELDGFKIDTLVQETQSGESPIDSSGNLSDHSIHESEDGKNFKETPALPLEMDRSITEFDDVRVVKDSNVCKSPDQQELNDLNATTDFREVSVPLEMDRSITEFVVDEGRQPSEAGRLNGFAELEESGHESLEIQTSFEKIDMESRKINQGDDEQSRQKILITPDSVEENQREDITKVVFKESLIKQ